MDTRRVRPQSERRRVSSNHRAEPTDPPVTRRYGAVQPAADADVSL